jgi:hypothetical protein
VRQATVCVGASPPVDRAAGTSWPLRDASAAACEWQFRLDRRALGVVHLKAIARVYGEHGAEMLELLRKAPADAVPVLLARLHEKDREWKRARRELNETWKAAMEKNYQKSLDHRSFYFKCLCRNGLPETGPCPANWKRQQRPGLH